MRASMGGAYEQASGRAMHAWLPHLFAPAAVAPPPTVEGYANEMTTHTHTPTSFSNTCMCA